jgi:NADH-quinone oxidoreductase subunit M
LAQVNVPTLLAYASSAFYSIFWWCISIKRADTIDALLYVSTVILLSAGLLLAWRHLEQRYGNLTLERMHGLARPMPCFATLFALLIMATVGLPPFSFFSAQVAMLVEPAGAAPFGLPIILLAWFLASWYLFRLMQRILFGPHREQLIYHDLQPSEAAPFVAVLLAVLLLGFAPRSSDRPHPPANVVQTALEPTTWRK